jgi:hypothetical protein
MAVLCLMLEYPGPERPQGTRAARHSWALINNSGFSFFWAERRPEVRIVQCRRVCYSIERLGLRRRAEGSGLEAAGKPPFVGPNGSAAARHVTGSAMREELVCISIVA